MSYCLVPVQTTVAIVLGEAGVRLPVLGQLHCCVLAVHHPDHLFARYKISNIHPGTRFWSPFPTACTCRGGWWPAWPAGAPPSGSGRCPSCWTESSPAATWHKIRNSNVVSSWDRFHPPGHLHRPRKGWKGGRTRFQSRSCWTRAARSQRRSWCSQEIEGRTESREKNHKLYLNQNDLCFANTKRI